MNCKDILAKQLKLLFKNMTVKDETRGKSHCDGIF